MARASFEAAATPLAQDTDLGRFGAWLDAERLVGELLGAALDFGPLVGEMVEWKGGPLRCLA